jgi:threonine synthase
VNLRCTLCQRTYPLETRKWRCECDGLFELDESRPFSADAIRCDVPTMWRYRDMLPVPEDAEIVSLGEGFTPLLPVQLYGARVLCKLEFLAPSGSFKDRGTSVLVSMVRALGVDEVVEDSSGNAAASLAAYCARAGIHARIFVPAHASAAKLAQIAMYGATVVPVEGPRENSALAAQEAARDAYYASHNYNPLFLEGTKTFAYEIWEHLGGSVPDNVVLPVGNGSLLVGAYRGFRDLRTAGLVDRLPRLFAAQAEACAPLYDAYRRGLDEPQPATPRQTIAEGICIAQPSRGRQVISAIRNTGGAVVAVDDTEIRSGRAVLARAGLYVEPTSATVAAALVKLNKMIAAEQITVVALTGSGLKTA